MEANDLWNFNYDNALEDAKYVAPHSRADALRWLWSYIEDPGHANCYCYFAYQLLLNLDKNKEHIGHDVIRNDITSNKGILDFLAWGQKNESKFIPFKDLYSGKRYRGEEQTYRKWCLDNTLFLNNLNDITAEWIAAQDILQFPSYIVSIGTGPHYSAAFSDIKNRFCHARHLAFQGLYGQYPKYAEKGLYLTDTLDNVDYSGSTENLKIAFRLCFSILDSLSSLINQYFEIKSKKPSFTNNWIKKYFKEVENPFIDALFWLSCDLTDASEILSWKAPNPSSSYIRIIRNSSEHNWPRIADGENDNWDKGHDYAQVISREQLKKSTIEVFELTRSAILYFIFAVKFNEKGKESRYKTVVKIDTPKYTGVYKYAK